MAIRTTRVGTTSSNNISSVYFNNTNKPTIRLYNDKSTPKYLGGNVQPVEDSNRIFTSVFSNIFG